MAASLDLRRTTSQIRKAVPRRERIQDSQTFVPLNSGLASDKGEEEKASNADGRRTASTPSRLADKPFVRYPKGGYCQNIHPKVGCKLSQLRHRLTIR